MLLLLQAPSEIRAQEPQVSTAGSGRSQPLSQGEGMHSWHVPDLSWPHPLPTGLTVKCAGSRDRGWWQLVVVVLLVGIAWVESCPQS